MKYILIAAVIGLTACSDQLPERERPQLESQRVTVVDPPIPTTVFSESDSGILTASAKSESVEQIANDAKQVKDEIKTVIEKAEQTVNTDVKKRVCFGPNNTDCVDVVVKPKFEGTEVPK